MSMTQRRDDVEPVRGYASIHALRRILNADSPEVWSFLYRHGIEPRRIARDRRFPLSEVVAAFYEGGAL